MDQRHEQRQPEDGKDEEMKQGIQTRVIGEDLRRLFGHGEPPGAYERASLAEAAGMDLREVIRRAKLNESEQNERVRESPDIPYPSIPCNNLGLQASAS
jgi:hypothetical protein